MLQINVEDKRIPIVVVLAHEGIVRLLAILLALHTRGHEVIDNLSRARRHQGAGYLTGMNKLPIGCSLPISLWS